MGKRLVFVRGPMGVGKTMVCRALLPLVEPAAWLDGDWCWTLRPFVVNEETKALALCNIGDTLRRFLRASCVETVLFSWVMHERAILDAVLERLAGESFSLRVFTLTAGAETLRARIEADIHAGLRDERALARSLAYLPLFGVPGGDTLGTDGRTAAQTAQEIAARLESGAQSAFLENF